MRVRSLRALVLTAGEGQRLSPLTDSVPKALLPVAGQPLVLRTLKQLAAAKFEAAALNLHHLGDVIRRTLSDEVDGMPLVYSEERELQGTLGALYVLREFFAEAELLVVINGDSLCRWPLRKIIRHHLRRRARATLLLSSNVDPAEFGGGVGIDAKGRVVSLRPGQDHGEVKRRLVFAGVHVLSPQVLRRLDPGPADFVADLYSPLLARGGEIHSFVTSRPWFDLGTPQRYLDGALAWGRTDRPRRWKWGAWRAPGAQVESGARLRSAVLEARSRVGRKALLERVVLLPGAVVGRGSRVRQAILGAEVALPARTVVERRLVTRQRPDASPPAGDSVLGRLVYSPFDREGRR